MTFNSGGELDALKISKSLMHEVDSFGDFTPLCTNELINYTDSLVHIISTLKAV